MSQTTTTTTLVLLSVLLIAATVVNGQGAMAPPPNAGMVCEVNLGLCAAALKVGAKPSDECCTSLNKAVKTQLKCLCAILTNPQVLAGFNLTVENAFHIPQSCGIDAGPSMCSGNFYINKVILYTFEILETLITSMLYGIFDIYPLFFFL